MKALYHLVFLLFMLPTIIYAQDPNFVAADIDTKLTINDLKDCAFSSLGSADAIVKAAQTRQLFRNELEAYQFLAKVQGKLSADLSGVGLSTFLATYADNIGKGNKALLFFSHPIDLKKFEQSEANKTNRAEINTKHKNIASIKANLKNQEKNNLENIQNIKNNIIRLKTKKDGKPATAGFPAVAPVPLNIDEERLLSELAKNVSLIEEQNFLIIRRIEELEKEDLGLQAEFQKLCNQYIEDKTVKYYIFHNSKIVGATFENDKYLADIDDLLIVCLGGEKDLAKMNIKITKKTNAFISSINATRDVLSSFGISTPPILEGAKAAPNADLDCKESDQKVAVTFIQLQNSKNLKSPYELKFEIPDNKDDITVDIHEINHFLVSFGLSAKTINPTYFNNLGGKIEVKSADLTAENSIKGDAYIMLNYCPVGRDLNKFSNKGRLSFSFGLKASKDPLQSMILGPTWALNNSIGLMAGVALNSLPKEGATLNTTNISTTTEYLLKNIDREYKVGFFFGLSISPSSFKNLLPSNEK